MLMSLSMLDYFLLLILILAVIAGYHRGLLQTLGGMVSLAAGLVLAALYCNDLVFYLDSKFHLVTVIAEGLEKKIPLPAFYSYPAVGSFIAEPEIFSPLHSQLAHLLLVVVSFVVLYLVISRLTNILWTLLAGVLGWGVLGNLNQMGGALLNLGAKVLGLSIVVGLLIPLVDVGSKLQMKWAITTRAYLDSSILVPSLANFFTLLSQFTGLSL
jgi:uncharacterized membrane protein required for colicin V production